MTFRRMRLVQLPVTIGYVVLLTLLVPCLSVTFEDGTSGSEAGGESFGNVRFFDRNGKFRNFGILKSKLQKDNSVSKEEVRNL